MQMKNITLALAVAGVLAAGPAAASLTTFQTFVGNDGVSTAGWGSTTQQGTITASVPVGATVLAAYLYTSTYNGPALTAGGTLAGNAITYTSLPDNATSTYLIAGRADVTSIVKPTIDGGPGGVYSFSITETASGQDGEALVVVYSLAPLPTTTIGILDGFSAHGGDSTSITFAQPLDPTVAGFGATMAIGDGFSFDGNGCTGSGQTSTIAVNGTTITNNAGCNDSSADASAANGNLITVGGYINGFSPLLPSVANDHEFYNLVPEITKGDTSILVNTNNPSTDDNIFLAVFDVTGVAGFNNPIPEPTTLALAGLGLTLLGFQRRRANRS